MNLSTNYTNWLIGSREARREKFTQRRKGQLRIKNYELRMTVEMMVGT